MSEAPKPAIDERASQLVNELKVTGHLMKLDPGLFCIVQSPSRALDAASGLPGVRISLPPGPQGRPDSVSISTFRPDGWLHGMGDAALVRVLGAPAQVLVTVYQTEGVPDGAPKLQVLRLLEAGVAPQPAAGAPVGGHGGATPQMGAAAAAGGAGPVVVDVLAHIQGRGDVGAKLGERLGEEGSKRWIEGFAIAPSSAVAMGDIEYQAVLGRGWLSPWVEGGQFCGSRGMALPVLGLKARLRGAAAESHVLTYAASFVDGSAVGPVGAGEACESEGLAAMESLIVSITARETAGTAVKPAAKPKAAIIEKPAAVAKPAAGAKAEASVKPAGRGKKPV